MSRRLTWAQRIEYLDPEEWQFYAKLRDAIASGKDVQVLVEELKVSQMTLEAVAEAEGLKLTQKIEGETWNCLHEKHRKKRRHDSEDS